MRQENETRNWEAEAAAHDGAANDAERRRSESQQRSDTDGFLSQWASGLTAQLERRRARICRQGGRSLFQGLYTIEGRRVAAELISAQYGLVWRLSDAEADKYGRRFIPNSPDNTSRVQKRLGLKQGAEWAPAWADTEGSGTGLSGHVWVATYRTGDKLGSDAEVCPGCWDSMRLNEEKRAECPEHGTGVA